MSCVTSSSLARGLRPHRCSDSKALEFSTPKRSVGALFLCHTYRSISVWFSHSLCVVLFHLSGEPLLVFLRAVEAAWKGEVDPCSRAFAGFCFCCSQVSVLCWGQISKTLIQQTHPSEKNT